MSLAEATKRLDKQFGKGTVRRLGDHDPVSVEAISTGILSLDAAIGVGGLPRGRVVEIIGAESGGKTSLTLSLIGQAQRLGDIAAFVDAEHSFDPKWAAKLGVNTDDLLVSQPDYGEQALEVAEALIKSGDVGLVVIDSVAALVPKAELDGEFGDSVLYETPIFIRRIGSKTVDIAQIGDLYGRGNNTGWYKKTNRIEVLTHQGWQRLLGVQKKKNCGDKAIIFTRTSTGYVGTTKDHSLFVSGKETSPNELKIFDRLDCAEIECNNNQDLITEDLAWLLGFYVAEGSTPRTKNSGRFSVCNTKKWLVEKCQEIVTRRFHASSEIRTVEATDIRQALYVLDCQTDESLGFYMQTCVSDKSFAKKVPTFVLNAKPEIKQAFLDGFWEGDGSSVEGKNPSKPRKYHNNSWLVIAGVQYLNRCLSIRTNVTIHPDRPEQMTLCENKGPLRRKENEVLQFYDYPAPEFLYDICTSAGTFVVAIGNIICHNSQMGLQARMMSQAMRKLTAVVHKSDSILVLINQIREKIGVMFGSPETTPGGRALRFYASVRLDVRKAQTIKVGDKAVGNRVKVKVIKNKCAAPFRTAEFDLLFDQGISREADLLDLGLEYGLIVQAGSWFSYKDADRIAQGRDNVIEALRNDKASASQLEQKIRELLK